MRESFAELGQELLRAINPFKLTNLQHMLAVLWLLNWKRQELNILRGRQANLRLPPTGFSSKHGSVDAYLYFSKRLYSKLVTSTKPVRQLLSETVVPSELFELRIFLLNYWHYLRVCLFVQLRTAALRLIVRSWLEVPAFATRRLHACHRARAPSGGRWNCGREMSGNFAEMTTSTPFRDLSHAVKL